jgi:signal transduction histidine kinase
MNLMLNARDAVADGGTIRVATLARADQVLLRIEDDGHGIAAEHLDQIFDPFFTTKKTGEGTGLGLSICLGIVQSHDGKIEVTSAPGDGTTFTIVLPALTETGAEEVVQ